MQEIMVDKEKIQNRKPAFIVMICTPLQYPMRSKVAMADTRLAHIISAFKQRLRTAQARYKENESGKAHRLICTWRMDDEEKKFIRKNRGMIEMINLSEPTSWTTMTAFNKQVKRYLKTEEILPDEKTVKLMSLAIRLIFICILVQISLGLRIFKTRTCSNAAEWQILLIIIR